MKLHFHGAEYEHPEMHLPAQDKEIDGTYRGSILKIHRHKVKCRHKNMGQAMSYRGVHYKLR